MQTQELYETHTGQVFTGPELDRIYATACGEDDYVPACRRHHVEDCSHVDCQIDYALEGF